VPHVAVTAVGPDRPGIVAAVTGVLLEHGGNLEDTAMTRLGGHFAMVLVVEVAEGADRLEAALAAATESLGLTVTVRSIADLSATDDDGAPDVVSVHGADRPGIVHRVTSVLADHGANVVDLATHQLTTDAGTGYVVLLEVLVPSNPDELVAALEATAADLGVDVTVRADDPDVL
jgi:glycine cleavage system transcriptional repressor